MEEWLHDEVERLADEGEGLVVVVGGELGQVGEDGHGEDQHVVRHDASQLLGDLGNIRMLI